MVENQQMKHLAVRSGGQTGVDRAALDCASAKRIPYGGWCPRGGWAEDMTTPPGLLGLYQHLVETPSSAPEQRTAWNVRDSDGSLVVVAQNGLEASSGTRFTVVCAQFIFQKPLHVASVAASSSRLETCEWLARVMDSADRTPFVLNVAGPRESECPGIYRAAFDFLAAVLEEAGPT
jgi:hypothetical protein